MATVSEALAIALAHHQVGRLAEAEGIYRQVLEAEPENTYALNDLGNLCRDLGRLEEAIALLQRAIEIKPESAEALNNLGSAFVDGGRLGEAVACYDRALILKPDFPAAHFNLGNISKLRGRLDDAAERYRRALQLDSSLIDAEYNLGLVLNEQGNWNAALACFRRVIELNPILADAHDCLGAVLFQLGVFGEAKAYFQRALELNPNYAHAHWNQSAAMLLAADFKRGWPEYEWRWKTDVLPAREFRQPRWQGEALAGKTILFHAEQGFGDTIQFIRYAPVVKAQGGTVIVECQKALVQLLASCSGIDQLVAEGEELPCYDVHCPLLSLAAILKTTLETIPANVPYLFVDPALVAQWRAKLEPVRGFRIGINWHGRDGNASARRRDIQLDQFMSLAQLPSVQLISLQKGSGEKEVAAADKELSLVDLGDFDMARGAFMDTAAIMMNLDLVITSDTAIPHLAGALGVPVWVALPYVPDWRWLLDRADSPWYPTMRLFRQKRLGEWDSVFSEMRLALKDLVARPRAAGDRK